MSTILRDVLEQISSCKSRDQEPVVIFDIDDTLIDCRHRKLKVFKDFVSQASISEQFPIESELIQNARLDQMRYRVHECMEVLKIDNEIFSKALFDFWLSTYFTNQYLAHDQPFPGAIDFVESCHQEAKIIYLTGRDLPGMGEGTKASLKNHGFPWDTERTKLMMKEDPQEADFEFKTNALKKIAQLGTVVASFENELKNLNQMAETFPEALMYWRDTLYLPDPPPPHHSVRTMKSF